MLERLVEQKKAITAANTECQPPAELHAQQWALAEKVVQVLKIFEEATREVSGNYSSAAVIIPIINTLKQALVIDDSDTGIMAMKRGMCSSLEGRILCVPFQQSLIHVSRCVPFQRLQMQHELGCC